ncbi:hypothetical protein [Aeromicrobium phoceense]|nr:hypothetical protein [Aeromicrobium phoceense]
MTLYEPAAVEDGVTLTWPEATAAAVTTRADEVRVSAAARAA